MSAQIVQTFYHCLLRATYIAKAEHSEDFKDQSLRLGGNCSREDVMTVMTCLLQTQEQR